MTTEVNEVSVILKEGMHFEADPGDGVRVQLDAEENVGGMGKGARPMKMMLVSVGGCTGMDVISILRKKRQDVTGLEVNVRGDRYMDAHPHIYEKIYVEFIVTGHGVDPAAVERSIQLSVDRYCPAIGLLKQVIPVETSYRIVEAE